MRVKLFIAVLAASVVAIVAAGAAKAALPITQSQPFQAVCEAQGGVFEVSVDFLAVYCIKEGALFTAFSPAQLAVQQTLCERVYGAVFGVFAELPNSTGTFCSTA